MECKTKIKLHFLSATADISALDTLLRNQKQKGILKNIFWFHDSAPYGRINVTEFCSDICLRRWRPYFVTANQAFYKLVTLVTVSVVTSVTQSH